MTASDLQLRTNNNTRVVVQANTGNVGIGTATPAGRLHIGAARPDIFLVGNTTANQDGLRIHYNETGGLRTGVIDVKGLSLRLRGESGTSGDGSTDRLFIDLTNGNVGIGKANPSEKLDVVGSIRSTMWNVFTVLNQQPGALPLNRQFTSNGGTLLLFASGSGFLSAGGGQIGMEVVIDNVVRATARGFTNEALSHKAFTTSAVVVIQIAAGQHNLLVRTMPNTVTDFNDFFTVTILELPWVQQFIFTPIGPIVTLIGPIVINP